MRKLLIVLFVVSLALSIIAGCGGGGATNPGPVLPTNTPIQPTATSTPIQPTATSTPILGSLSGRAINEDGTPVANAYIVIYSYSNYPSSTYYTNADPNGSYSYNVPLGLCYIESWGRQSDYDPNKVSLGSIIANVSQSPTTANVTTGIFSPKPIPTVTPSATPTSAIPPTITPSPIITATPSVTPVVYAGVSYYGKGKILDANSPITYSDSHISVSEPKEKYFEADGFFNIKGQINNPDAQNYYIMQLYSKSDPNMNTAYWVQSNFEKRVWLRFGQGEYYLKLYRVASITNQSIYGVIYNWTYITTPSYTFTIKNTNTVDGTYLYPSDTIQSDDPNIASIATQLSKGTDNTTKIKAAHNYVISYLYYDSTSYDPNNQAEADRNRKKQDALSTLYNKMGVCEGYTCLNNAILRNMGIDAKYIRSDMISHAWSNVYNVSRYYLVDTTWDDPKPYDTDPNHVLYTYFMLENLNGIDNDHPGAITEYRGNVKKAYKMPGYPDGIY